MKVQYIYLIISLFITLNSFAVQNSGEIDPGPVSDGPYIFNVNDTLKVKWIENNVLKEDLITQRNYTRIKTKFNLQCNYKDLTDTYLKKPDYDQDYTGVDSISVISDIHGQYNRYIDLLKASGIIDDNLNWKFGKGHLVVAGDMFDRGDMVTEILWHLFGLEKQAAKAGGMVHVILGNHEVMVLNGDLGFINEKYREVEAITKTEYSDLYSVNSVLGRWLRNKPVVITIDNCIFIHGGLSMALTQRNLKISDINKIFSDKIVGKELQAVDDDEELTFLDGNFGPLWYRGYFLDTTFYESKADSILDYFGKEHIVVGHTTYYDIKTLFNNKIFGVDAGIMADQPGEMLLYKEGVFYKVLISGKRFKL